MSLCDDAGWKEEGGSERLLCVGVVSSSDGQRSATQQSRGQEEKQEMETRGSEGVAQR